uniref:Uncharacterized LOC108950037 n=1 Tax=Ciona intestinalis TaxID=7719 RepID=H2XXI2_CIOIN|nr:uncharacterized protein LOC108950037 [Ciona intestinalis]|eukprot:XP_026693073.1 uncharacterized protein LOC108950037 [Ciona intestinalis]
MSDVDSIDFVSSDVQQETTLFWDALDKVWGSVIDHCVAIFISLNFTSPSVVNVGPPELQQQLSGGLNLQPPGPEVAIHVLPMFATLVDNLGASIERFLTLCSTEGNPLTSHDCLDVLQTLWTTSQALAVTTDIEKVHTPASLHLVSGVQEEQSKLFIGHQKLKSVSYVLKECYEKTNSLL